MTNQLAFKEIVKASPLYSVKEVAGRTRYLGSKARISDKILDIVGAPAHNSGAFVDVFSGTGVVSRQAALRGWKIVANDHLFSASVTTMAQLLSKEDVPFGYFGGYSSALTQLSQSIPVSGFVFREYTPSGKSKTGQKRQYFTPENGRQIDGLRKVIEDWHLERKITTLEKTLLIADLLSSTNAIANIAGTYGCFLSYWSSNALRPLELRPRTLLNESSTFSVLNVDAFEISTLPEDVAYLDPPYTKRQYAAYYHILETIAAGDCPEVEGVTGLRPWKEKSSLFCYKTKALSALERLIGNLNAQRIILSYSSEGHMALKDVESLLKQFGTVTVHTIDEIGRYRPNQGASAAGKSVTEYLVDLVKKPMCAEVSR
jgi:adenine-specific DNA-methyltransferase